MLGRQGSPRGRIFRELGGLSYPWSGLPLHRILYIPFSIFAYSSNIFIGSFAWMGSILAGGISKKVKFSLRSFSLNDHDPVMKLICSTFQPCRWIVMVRGDLRDAFS